VALITPDFKNRFFVLASDYYRLAIVTDHLLAFQAMPIRYREILKYMQGYLAAYPLGFQADEIRQQHIVADRNGYRLGESADLKAIEEMVKSENEAFANTMQRKTLRQLIAMFASLTRPDANGKQRAVVSGQAAV
jgi:hypothetical protein